MAVYRYGSDYQYNPDPSTPPGRNGRIRLENGNSKALGKTAVALVFLPLVISLMMAFFGKIAFPCDTTGFSQGPFGCDTKAANDYAAIVWLPMLLHILMIPVSIILGIIAIIKKDGAGWGILAFLPIPGWFAFWTLSDLIHSIS
jgi:hypothetical protein